ncbi:MAG: ribonuclease III family protein [Dehalococcoidia bacterium]
MNEYIKIEKKLGLSFKNQKLLQNALNHSSLKNEDLEIQSNEDLEFIGDSVMYFIISNYIYKNNEAKISVGEMSIIRSNIISNQTFSVFANKLNLGEYIKTGKGQKKIGISDLMLSNCFEALIGAIYIDSGFSEVKNFVNKNFKEEINYIFSKRPIRNEKMIDNETKQKRLI